MHAISSGGDGPDGVRLADLDGDGLEDVVTSFETSGEVMVYLHPASGVLSEPWPSVNVGSIARGEDALGMDVDGDGAIDIVSSHEGDTMGIYVHWAPIDPTLYMLPEAWGDPGLIPHSKGRSWMFALPMDVNQDGRMDLVAGSKDDYEYGRDSVGDIGWFEAPVKNRRDLDSWAYHSIGLAGWTMSIIAYDVNGDGFDDLLLTDRNADVDHMGARWLQNPGEDWDQPWLSHFLGDLAGTRPTFMAFGDLDGDDIDEFIVPLSDQAKVIILHRTSVGNESEYSSNVIEFSTESGYGLIKAVEVHDIDNDGRMDIIVTFVGGQYGVIWASYQASPFEGPWDLHVISEVTGAKFDLIQLYDVDGDGDEDILTTEEVHNLGVLWFENPLVGDD